MRIALCLIPIFWWATLAHADVELAPDPASPGDILVDAERSYPRPPPSPRPPAPGSGLPVPSPTPPPDGSACQPDLNGEYQCYYRDDPDAPDTPDRPALTEGHVERAVREVGLPRLAASVQPAGRTLVNVPTILHTSPQAFERSISLLGYRVDLSASPDSYRWVHGDGSSQVTSDAGRPYPSDTIRHVYRKASSHVPVRVDVTYTVRFRVDSGPWETLGSRITAEGPPTVIRVDQAGAVLTTP